MQLTISTHDLIRALDKVHAQIKQHIQRDRSTPADREAYLDLRERYKSLLSTYEALIVNVDALAQIPQWLAEPNGAPKGQPAKALAAKAGPTP